MFDTLYDQFKETRMAFPTDHGKSREYLDWAFTRDKGVMMPTVCNYGKNYKGATGIFR